MVLLHTTPRTTTSLPPHHIPTPNHSPSLSPCLLLFLPLFPLPQPPPKTTLPHTLLFSQTQATIPQAAGHRHEASPSAPPPSRKTRFPALPGAPKHQAKRQAPNASAPNANNNEPQ